MRDPEWMHLRTGVSESVVNSLPLFKCMEALLGSDECFAGFRSFQDQDDGYIRAALVDSIRIRVRLGTPYREIVTPEEMLDAVNGVIDDFQREFFTVFNSVEEAVIIYRENDIEE